MEMDNYEKENSLQQDKALVEALFSKEHLMQFEENQMQASDTFFEQQEASILKVVGKQQVKILSLRNWAKLAVAASLLAIITTTYIFIQRDPQTDNTLQYVKIEEIPSDEIENYVNNNELVAEIDWSEEINEEVEIFDDAIIKTNKDTNKIE